MPQEETEGDSTADPASPGLACAAWKLLEEAGWGDTGGTTALPGASALPRTALLARERQLQPTLVQAELLSHPHFTSEQIQNQKEGTCAVAWPTGLGSGPPSSAFKPSRSGGGKQKERPST